MKTFFIIPYFLSSHTSRLSRLWWNALSIGMGLVLAFWMNTASYGHAHEAIPDNTAKPAQETQVVPEAAMFPQPDIWYKLRNITNDNYLDTGTGGLVKGATNSNGEDKQWQFVADGSGGYTIINRQSGRGTLDTSPGNVVTWKPEGSNGGDRWTVETVGDGTYRFRSQTSGRDYLYLNDAGAALWNTGEATEATQWLAEPIEVPVGDGLYPFPYKAPEGLISEAQAISDQLKFYIRQWLDGKVPAELPDEIIPSALFEGYQDLKLVRYEDIIPEDQWIIGEAEPVDFDSLYGLFRDANCTYILSWNMLVPFGDKVVVEGDFPYSRFFDIQTIGSYTPGAYGSGYNGQAELPIVDVDIPAVPGSINPFKAGANRLAPNRAYRQEFIIAMGEPTETNPEGFTFPFRDPNPTRFASGIMNIGPLGDPDFGSKVPFFLTPFYSPQGEWTGSEMWFRYYAPDLDKGPMAGVKLPKMHYETPEGERYFIAYDDTEAERNANSTVAVNPDEGAAPTDPCVGWGKLAGIFRSGLINFTERLPFFLSDPEEVRRLDLTYAGRDFTAPGLFGLEASKTLVPYTNYLTRSLCTEKGRVVAFTGKLPTFPDTRDGAPTMNDAQMRYWSISTYNIADIFSVGQGLGTLMDDEITLDDERQYVIVWSRAEDRPANCTPENNCTWKELAPVACQSFFIRWMSVEPNWAFELTPDEVFLPPAKVVPTGSEYDPTLIGQNTHDGILGTYLPEIHYLTTEEFEALGTNVSFSSIPAWCTDPSINSAAWVQDISDKDRLAALEEVPLESERLKAYPNPSHGQTTIRYTLPESTQVRLSVYDVAGHEVAVLVSGSEEAGTKEVIFNTAQLPRGTYLYRLSTSQTTETNRLLLTK